LVDDLWAWGSWEVLRCFGGVFGGVLVLVSPAMVGAGFFGGQGGLPLSHALFPQSSMNNEDTKLLIVRHF